MKKIEESLDKLGLVIQKHEEVFDIIIEDQKSKHKIIPDETFITLMMFRKIAERLDAIFVLLENKSENAARSISRNLIENFLYFIYVIDSRDRYKTRALSYYFSNLKDQINLSYLLLSKGQKGRKIRDYLNTENGDNEILINKAKRAKEHYQNCINSDKYINIKVEWNRFNKNGIKYPNWYSLSNGPKNLRELAGRCGYEVEYELLYGIYSRQVHSANVMDQFENVNGLAGIRNLRMYVNPTLELIFPLRLGIESLKRFIEFFEMDDEINIEQWEKNYI
ncbi:DUF5677 domain-containing protein [Virgibacillus oceani]|uniref:Uncharacterized protein n=1 Tax=Virgibacillus oceani TaxID=1479511 RepID=A0A917H1K4_9BACI|nr:DUF5677 domain-containing protein [Virgibacillus oceani]GGG64626.1 hypothetical protein GCM10011398_05300 [Virgibacillus oceani]